MTTAIQQLNADFFSQSFNAGGLPPPLALKNMATEIDLNNLINGGTVTGDLHVTGTVFANISGTVAPGPISGATITASTVDSSIIGGVTAAAATFTALTATSTVGLSPANKDVTISPSGTGKFVSAGATAGSINNVVIGNATPLAATFTTATSTTLNVTSNLVANATSLGFYGTTAIIKQTGVSVTAGGIHAALINLGLIAA